MPDQIAVDIRNGGGGVLQNRVARRGNIKIQPKIQKAIIYYINLKNSKKNKKGVLVMYDSRELHVNGESIRIRFTDKMKKQLFQEKERTGKSVSEIVRQAVYEYLSKNK